MGECETSSKSNARISCSSQQDDTIYCFVKWDFEVKVRRDGLIAS